MKYLINYLDLIPGDIILDRNDGRQSKLICEADKCVFSHARLYVGGTIMESEGNAVQSVNPQRLLYPLPDYFVILRLKDPHKVDMDAVCRYARSEFGKEYAGIDFRKSRIKPESPEQPNKQYCTRFVAKAYEAGGLKLVENTDFCTVKEILQSPYLQIVDKIWHEASDEEISLAEKPGVFNQKDEDNTQGNAISALLETIRNNSNDPECDVQNETQLVNYILEHPELDETVNKILRESEYFMLWKRLEDENPEDYDYQKFIEKYGDDALERAANYLNQPCSHVNNWEKNFENFILLAQLHKLKLFESFAEMYFNAIASHNRRMNTYRDVCAQYFNQDCQ